MMSRKATAVSIMAASLAMVVFTSSVQGSLVSYWDFEGDFQDSVGSNHLGTFTYAGTLPGTFTNNATTGAVAGRSGQSLILDGVGDGLRTIANSDTLNVVAGDSYTYSFWFKAVLNTLDNNTNANPGDGRSTFVMRVVPTNPNNGYAAIADLRNTSPSLETTATTFLRTTLDAGDNTQDSLVHITEMSTPKTPIDYFDNTWHHFVAVASKIGAADGYHRLYLDNVKVAEDLDITNLTGGGATTSALGQFFYVGAERDNGARWLLGSMDDLAFWNQALSESQISALFNGANPISVIPEPSAFLFVGGIGLLGAMGQGIRRYWQSK